MGNLFKDLTAGFSAFVLSWLVPSAIVVTVFALFVYPELTTGPATRPQWQENVSDFADTGPLAAISIVFAAVVALAVLSALASRPLYRLLEGYSFPTWVARPMRARELRRYARLRTESLRHRRGNYIRRGLVREQLLHFPSRGEWILPTRLGNSLKALETFSTDRYQLDSQTLWYEVNATAPERARKDADDARASVDFFISLVGLLGLLALAATVVSVSAQSKQSAIVAVLALAATRPAYNAALQNMTDWHYAVQALVNLSRPDLAKALGYKLPTQFSDERRFWSAWTAFVQGGRQTRLQELDHLRVQPMSEVTSIARGDQDADVG
jgi:hypothetical protein